MGEIARTITAIVITLGILVVLCIVFWKINKRYYREMERGFWDSEKTLRTSRLKTSFYPKPIRYKEEDCWITKCEKCRREILSSREKSLDKLPTRCSGCGSELTWSMPYTRVEIECTNRNLLECKNIVHHNKWKEKTIWRIWEVLSVVLDESVEKVEIKVKERG